MSLAKKALTLLINISLIAASLAGSYVAAEWLFLHRYTSFFPLITITRKFDNYKGVYPLLQSSKKGFYPENYVAISGDSYAIGLGDDAFSGDPYSLRNHSAHVLQDITGKDIVSYGIPGSGSVRGMITNPVSIEAYIRNIIREDYPAPEWVLFYFYEGNDLTENWIYYQKTFLPYHEGQNYLDPSIFGHYIDKTAVGRDHLYLSAVNAKFHDGQFLYRYIRRLYIQSIENKRYFSRKYKQELRLKYEPDYKWVNRPSDNPINKAIIQGEIRPMADNMQGPSMDLTEQQTRHALETFSLALAHAKKYFKHSKHAVIYIPSVLSIYNTSGNQVHSQNFFSDTDQLFSRDDLEQRSLRIQQAIRKRTEAQDVLFIDTTSDLQNAANTEFIHGPNDWNHFNLVGYSVLGQSIAQQMSDHW